MKCIYEVKYDIQWESVGPAAWEEQTVNVFAEEDALEAVDKARQVALNQHRLDDNGRENKCTGFRLRGVTLVAQADL